MVADFKNILNIFCYQVIKPFYLHTQTLLVQSQDYLIKNKYN
jgi:hypothetical protein